jgi:predicted N-acetyltransferase YhbS
MLRAVWNGLVQSIEAKHSVLAGAATKEHLFGAFVEAVGPEQGCALLRQAASEDDRLRDAIGVYLSSVQERGFAPRQLYFAIERFRRWAELGEHPSREAMAHNVREIYDTYRLGALRQKHPYTRVRFFRDTVLRFAEEPVAQGLDVLLSTLVTRPMEPDDFVDRVASLRAVVGSDEEYFLARLTYPHLRPDDAAAFGYTGFGGARTGDVVVSLTDTKGKHYVVRHPVNPREIGTLQRLFDEAQLSVPWQPEHHFLVAVADRGEVIGGLVYEVDTERSIAHMHKVVVARRYRGRGIGEGVMQQLISRAKEQGIRALTVGYFRPDYFARFGFQIDHRFAGQVLPLVAASLT